MVCNRGIYGVVYSTMIIGMFRYIIIIIYEVPTEVPIPVADHKDGDLWERDCRPFVSDTSPKKCIDREGLKRRRTGQLLP